MLQRIVIICSLCFLACGTDISGTAPFFELGGDKSTRKTFFDFPFPSDLRVSGDGTPDLEGYPVRDTKLFTDLVALASETPGFPVMPVAYFRFDGPITDVQDDVGVWTSLADPVLLMDIDPGSPDRGSLTPVVARTLVADNDLPGNILAVAPRPGFVLAPRRTYGVVVKKSFGAADGSELLAADGLAELMDGRPEVAAGVYAPLFDALESEGVNLGELSVATVFTTGDVVEELYAITEGVRARRSVVLENVAAYNSNGSSFCEVHATVRMPQYQKGTPPYNQDGLFVFDEAGIPIEQDEVAIPVVIAVPREPMPDAGYPLTMYFHGSGGYSREMITSTPSIVLANHGIATAGAALPANPERVPGATEQEYLNFNNLAAFRDTFRQGVIEQRLLLDALLDLRLSPSVFANCSGPSLPNGTSHYFFDADHIMAQGQSMGGMYTNLVSAVEPRIRASVPTGAGGFWNYFILETSLIPGGRSLLATMLRSPEDELAFLHPAMHLLGSAWEPAEPMVYMPRIAWRPLPGHQPRHIYEPVAPYDEYFPQSVYDAVILAYRHPLAGQVVWSSTLDALSLLEFQATESYPVHQNLTSVDGQPYTGIAVQYSGGHFIFAQLDAVKHQYGCFLETVVTAGAPTVPEPSAMGAPCAGQ